MESILQEIANVGLTIFCVVIGCLIVNWLDITVFSSHKNFNKENDND